MKAITAPKIVTLSSFAVAMSFVLTGCGGAGVNVGGQNVSNKLAATYKMTAIHGPVGSTGMEIREISPNGVIAGQYKMNGNYTCFIVKDGVRTDVTPTDHNCHVEMVHDDGSMEGYYEVGNKNMPFTTAGGTFMELPMYGSFLEGEAKGRDSQGNLFVSYYSDEDSLATKSSGAATVPMTVQNSQITGMTAVSPSGIGIGWGEINGTRSTVMFDKGATVGKPILQGKSGVSTFAINDSKNFVGGSNDGQTTKAFINFNGQHITLPSIANSYYASLRGINAGNVAVGLDQAGNETRGIAWSESDGYVDLATRIEPVNGIVFRWAYSIDDNGTIIGLGTDMGTQVGIILTPVK